MIKTAVKVVALGVAVAATAEVLRRTGVIEKGVDKVREFSGTILMAAFEKAATLGVEDNTPEDGIHERVTSDGMYR